MTQAGNYTITAVIKNDVSVQSLSVKIAVKQPGKKFNSRADFKHLTLRENRAYCFVN